MQCEFVSGILPPCVTALLTCACNLHVGVGKLWWCHEVQGSHACTQLRRGLLLWHVCALLRSRPAGPVRHPGVPHCCLPSFTHLSSCPPTIPSTPASPPTHLPTPTLAHPPFAHSLTCTPIHLPSCPYIPPPAHLFSPAPEHIAAKLVTATISCFANCAIEPGKSNLSKLIPPQLVLVALLLQALAIHLTSSV